MKKTFIQKSNMPKRQKKLHQRIKKRGTYNKITPTLMRLILKARKKVNNILPSIRGVAARLGLPYPTVRKFLDDYAKAGNQLPGKSPNGKVDRCKIDCETAAYLKDKQTLQELAHYGLR